MQNVFSILTRDQETNFTPKSKRFIEAKINKQKMENGGGWEENEMALAKFFIFLIFTFLNYKKTNLRKFGDPGSKVR